MAKRVGTFAKINTILNTIMNNLDEKENRESS